MAYACLLLHAVAASVTSTQNFSMLTSVQTDAALLIGCLHKHPCACVGHTPAQAGASWPADEASWGDSDQSKTEQTRLRQMLEGGLEGRQWTTLDE